MHVQRGSKIKKATIITAAAIFASNLNAASFSRAFSRVERLFGKGRFGGVGMVEPKMIKPEEKKPVVELPKRMVEKAALEKGEEKGYTLVGTYNITNPQTGDKYVERIYVSDALKSLLYDPSTDKITADGKGTYRIKFTHDAYGIPISYPGQDPERTDRHRVGIRMFSGEEATTGTISVGEGLSIEGAIGVVLDVVSASPKAAIVTITDGHENFISQDQINEGDTLKKTIGGKEYKIHCSKVNVNYHPINRVAS